MPSTDFHICLRARCTMTVQFFVISAFSPINSRLNNAVISIAYCYRCASTNSNILRVTINENWASSLSYILEGILGLDEESGYVSRPFWPSLVSKRFAYKVFKKNNVCSQQTKLKLLKIVNCFVSSKWTKCL